MLVTEERRTLAYNGPQLLHTKTVRQSETQHNSQRYFCGSQSRCSMAQRVYAIKDRGQGIRLPNPDFEAEAFGNLCDESHILSTPDIPGCTSGDYSFL